MHRTRVALVITYVWCLLAGVSLASADWVKLPDGRVVEGRIVRKVDGAVWFVRAGEEKEELLLAPEFLDAGFGAMPATYRLPAEGPSPDAARGVVITLGSRESDQGDTVGVHITAANLERLVPCLEQELGATGERIVLLRVCSGGGYWSEVEPIVKVLEGYTKRWRVVCWNDKAIGKAAMIAHCVPEHVFTTDGLYGAATAWGSCLSPGMQNDDLETLLRTMERISAHGQHDPKLMRAMQIQMPLSCTRDSDGQVRWFADETSGTILINREQEILCLNSTLASACGFSKGTADSLGDVGRLLCQGGVEWVGEVVEGVAWPVCIAERENVEFRRRTRASEDALRKSFGEYSVAASDAASVIRSSREPLVHRARARLAEMQKIARTEVHAGLAVLQCDSDAALEAWFARESGRLDQLIR